jgi:hypothetical protein
MLLFNINQHLMNVTYGREEQVFTPLSHPEQEQQPPPSFLNSTSPEL